MAVAIGLGTPVIGASVAGARGFFGKPPGWALTADPDLWSRAALAIAAAADDFTNGWGAGTVFNNVTMTDGSGASQSVSTSKLLVMPAGGSAKLGLVAVTSAGLALMVGWVAKKVTGAKQIKVAGQTVA